MSEGENIPQMREQIESLTKDLTSSREKTAVVEKDNRRLLARDLAREQGYEASRGELFAAANPDAEVTAENLDAFVQLHNLGKASESGDGGAGSSSEGGNDPTGASNVSSDLAQMSRGGSRPGDSAGGATQEKMTRQAWQALHQTDKTAAREALRQGRVEIDPGNPWGDPRPVAPGVNPYAPSVQK